MSIRKYKAEQIVTVPRQVEVAVANGKSTPQACKEAGIHTQTYYRWRKEYGGLKMEQAKRMKERYVHVHQGEIAKLPVRKPIGRRKGGFRSAVRRRR